MQNEETITEEAKNGVLDEAKIASVKKELEEHEAGLKDKVYAVPVDTDDMLDSLRKFINDDCEWKGMEAYGIKKVSEALRDVRVKSGCVFLPSLEIQGLAFFIMRNTGKGFKSAEKMVKMNDVIESAMKQIKSDNDKLQSLQMNLAALEHGINITGEEEPGEEEPDESNGEPVTEKAE